jgi:hypothetical protein
MNQYSELLNYIKAIAEKDPFVNTITQGEISDSFLNKADIYPMLHIGVDAGSFTNGSMIVFDVVLTCLQQRDTNKEIVNDKFFLNDNEVDNHNETLSSLNRIWAIMYDDLYHRNIRSSENPTLQKITDEKVDRLDGWQLTFNVELPNKTINLCEGEI